MFILLSSSTKIDSAVKLAHLVVRRMLLSVVLCICACLICVLTAWASIGDPASIVYRRKFETRRFIGATTVGTGGDWSPTFRLGTNNVLVPQLIGHSFQKARNFTSSVTRMQDLASKFSKIFREWHPRTLTTGGATPSSTQHPARPLTGREAQAPQCWDPNLGPPQLFSRGCAHAEFIRTRISETPA